MAFHLLRPQDDITCGKGALHIDEALIAAAAEAEADVTLGLQERAVNENIEFTDNIEQGRIFHDLLPGVSGVAPYVVAEFLLDAVDERSGSFGLQQGVSSAERHWSLVVGNDLHELIHSALFPTLEIP